MTEPDPAQTTELDFIATLYGDPVRDSTNKAGRNLLIMSLLLIAVVKFGAQVQATALFPIRFEHEAVLPTVLATLVMLLLLNFAGRVVMDIGLFLEGERRIESYVWKAKVDAANKAARDVDHAIEVDQNDPHFDPDPWWDEAIKVADAAKAAEESAERRLGRRNAFRNVRMVRAGGEALLPLAFALTALILSATLLRWPS
jgi:hypothetical protein